MGIFRPSFSLKESEFQLTWPHGPRDMAHTPHMHGLMWITHMSNVIRTKESCWHKNLFPIESLISKSFFLLNFLNNSILKRRLLMAKKKSPRRRPRMHLRKKRTRGRVQEVKQFPFAWESYLRENSNFSFLWLN